MIVDEHPVVRRGLFEILHESDALQVVAQVAAGREAVRQFSAMRPEVVLLDLKLRDMSGVEVIEAIRDVHDSVRIIVVTAMDGEEDIYRGLRAGAQGYVLKDASEAELVEAVLAVTEGRRYLARSVAEKLADHIYSNQLSERESEILSYMATGLTNKGIARMAKITEGTVKFHVNSILGKMNCASRTEAVACALKRGLIRLP